ncbi:hypothetical protein PS865_03213 [Pseudomonas fluorescens]|uniref:hypothetical protein n=1 Tax=Pseudomonas fluorescens TaxID=294 RepID=UPI001241A3CD|nr:hypothetical protein [Pseudomonas fluorescens]VVP08177.1 hypothetical protein PS865_03213 [Pseudomonas fluorescens]
MKRSFDFSSQQAGRGTPDYSFGVGSKVYLYGTGQRRLQVRTVTALTEPGRILCGASSEELGVTYLFMLDGRGVIDESFGEAGVAIFRLSELFYEWGLALPYSVKFDISLRKYVMGFFVQKEGVNRASGLARFELNGQLDVSFGNKGVMIWSPDMQDVAPESSALQEAKSTLTARGRDYHGAMELMGDGGVLLLTSLDNNGLFDLAYVVKVKNDGALNEEFGNDGWLRIVKEGANLAVTGEDLVRQGDNYLVAASAGIHDKSWFVGRYDAQGDVDYSFGINGYYEGLPSVKNLILKRDDRSQFYLAGTSDNGVPQYLFLQLQRRGINGEEDPHFGSQGWTAAISGDFNDIHVLKAALYNSASTIVLAGLADLRREEGSQAFIASIEQDMGWDEAFGDEGKVLLPKGEVIHDLVLQQDRKIVFISSVQGAPDSFAIVRLNG